ncbi:MAG TPA: hypothetical protein VIT85_02005 [Solirubrobacterales bacterium]
MATPKEALDFEARWATRVAIATLLGVALLIASVFAVSSLGGGGEAESLRSVHDHASTVTISSILQAVGFALLVAPLVFLFKAAAARSPKMRQQFLPLVIAAPLALGVASVLNGAAANEAAQDFVDGKATTAMTQKEAVKECREEKDKAADCPATTLEDDKAKSAIDDASLRSVSEGFRLGGSLGLAFALLYGCLFAMRAGLLSRFWGSLGMALGVACVLGLYQFSLIWFVYFGLLAGSWLPKGRPPAWETGEAIPWPTPGEKAAAGIGTDPDVIDGEAEEEPADPAAGANGSSDPPRKRKKRD